MSTDTLWFDNVVPTGGTAGHAFGIIFPGPLNKFDSTGKGPLCSLSGISHRAGARCRRFTVFQGVGRKNGPASGVGRCWCSARAPAIWLSFDSGPAGAREKTFSDRQTLGTFCFREKHINATPRPQGVPITVAAHCEAAMLSRRRKLQRLSEPSSNRDPFPILILGAGPGRLVRQPSRHFMRS